MNSSDAQRDNPPKQPAHALSRRALLAWLDAAGASAILGAQNAGAWRLGGALPAPVSGASDDNLTHQGTSARLNVVPQSQFLLYPADFRHHVDFFNAMAPEDVVTFVPDAAAWDST